MKLNSSKITNLKGHHHVKKMSLKGVKRKITVLRKISTDADVMDSDVTAKELIPARIISSGETPRYFSNYITGVPA